MADLREYVALNPFRTLGVLANSTLKQREASFSRLSAYAHIGKQTTTEFDFTKLIDLPVDRSENDLKEAQHDLALPKDRLEAAIFWFAAQDDEELLMLRLLDAPPATYTSHSADYSPSAPVADALNFFENKNSWSALLNLHTYYSVKGDLHKAAEYISLIFSDSHRQSFIDALQLQTLRLDEETLILTYFKMLEDFVGFQQALKAFEGLSS